MIKNPFLSYLQKLTFFSIAVCFVDMLLWLFVKPDYIRNVPYYVAVYYIVTLLFWAFLYYAPKRKLLRFEQAYMVSKIGKLLIYALIFALVLLAGLEKNTKFAFAYLALYVVYLIFDSITTLQLVRKNNEDNKNK